jgi:hypothetical protein
MKKTTLLLVFCLAAAVIYISYIHYMPRLIAQVIVAEKLPPFIPTRVQQKIETVRKPVNESAAGVVEQIHKAHIPMNKVLNMIDNTTEEQAYSMLDELTTTPLKTTDQAFDIAKKHISADFDIEVLRKPFNENVDLKLIKMGIRYGNSNRKNNIDIETAKVIAKQLLLQKERDQLTVDKKQ